MAIISGIWMWGNSAVSNGNFSIDVNFTSYPNDSHYTKLSSFYSIPYDVISYGTSETSVWITGNNNVVTDEYKYMDFGDGGQKISDTAYNYINKYATKISNSTKILISLENLQYFKTKLDNLYESKNTKIIYGQKTFEYTPKVGLSENSLPSGYQEVKYIETTGSQWINTSLAVFQNTTWEFEFDLAINEFYDYLAIVGLSDGGTNIEAWIESEKNFYLRYNGTKPSAMPITFDRCTIKVNYDGTTVREYLNDSKITSYTVSNNLSTSEVYLLKRDSNYTKLKLYGAKITTGGVLSRNFIPCYRISDNKTGLYDLITSEFYPNQATTEFNTGEKIQYGDDLALASEVVNVEANPVETSTDTLSKIKIGEIIYEISGANISSGNLKMERLYYTTGRTTSGTITLPKSIYNYDFLIIGGKNNDNYINYKPVVIDSDYSINQNQSLGFYNPGYVNFIFTSETELTITGQNSFGIFAIYGYSTIDSNTENKVIISTTLEEETDSFVQNELNIKSGEYLKFNIFIPGGIIDTDLLININDINSNYNSFGIVANHSGTVICDSHLNKSFVPAGYFGVKSNQILNSSGYFTLQSDKILFETSGIGTSPDTSYSGTFRKFGGYVNVENMNSISSIKFYLASGVNLPVGTKIKIWKE